MPRTAFWVDFGGELFQSEWGSHLSPRYVTPSVCRKLDPARADGANFQSKTPRFRNAPGGAGRRSRKNNTKPIFWVIATSTGFGKRLLQIGSNGKEGCHLLSVVGSTSPEENSCPTTPASPSFLDECFQELCRRVLGVSELINNIFTFNPPPITPLGGGVR